MDRSQLAALLDAQQSVIEKIAFGEPLSVCLTTICQSIERLLNTPEAKSSILLLEGNQLYHGAAPMLPSDFCNAIDGVEIGA